MNKKTRASPGAEDSVLKSGEKGGETWKRDVYLEKKMQKNAGGHDAVRAQESTRGEVIKRRIGTEKGEWVRCKKESEGGEKQVERFFWRKKKRAGKESCNIGWKTLLGQPGGRKTSSGTNKTLGLSGKPGGRINQKTMSVT